MDVMTHDDTYREAVKVFGLDAQIDMAIEECAELITALQHYKRNRVSVADVRTEIADVTIMARQLMLAMNPKATSLEIRLKTERLQRRIVAEKERIGWKEE